MSSKKVVTVRQLEILIEFMEKHKDLARGQVRSKEGRALSQRLWRDVTASLNAENTNSFRDSKEWNKFYNDYTCRLKNKLKKINNNQTGTGGGPAEPISLSPLEERLAAILGPDNFLNLPVQHNPVPLEPEIEQTQFEINATFNDEFESIEYLEEPSALSQNEMGEIFTEMLPVFEKNSNIEPETTQQELNSAASKSSGVASKSSAKRHKAESEVEKTRGILLEIEKERNENLKAQIANEKKKIAAINNLANAVWAIANYLIKKSPEKNTNKRRTSTLESDNDQSD